ncbi:MAG TPA: hypothetical protein PKC69_00385 [Chitinophagaceae bacterium]|nr:hypothetical protein [Chitinophagaceae bacterium]
MKKSEFFWGLAASLLVVILLAIFDFWGIEKSFTKEHTQQEKTALRLASFTPVIIVYSLAGIVMVLFKKSRMFALGLLLAALILFALAFFLYPPETLLIF